MVDLVAGRGDKEFDERTTAEDAGLGARGARG